MESRPVPTRIVWAGVCGPLTLLVLAGWLWGAEPAKYCRFQIGDTVAYGLVEGDSVRQLEGDLFGKWSKTNRTHRLDEVQLLVPTRPTQVLAMAGNYKSHLGKQRGHHRHDGYHSAYGCGDQTKRRRPAIRHGESFSPGEVPPRFAIPQPFFKTPSCLIPTAQPL